MCRLGGHVLHVPPCATHLHIIWLAFAHHFGHHLRSSLAYKRRSQAHVFERLN